MANVGGIDRIARIAIGAILLVVGLKPDLVGMAASGALHWVALVVGLVMLGTGLFKFCPLYPLLGINTCPMKK